jgi:hypothetical protein
MRRWASRESGNFTPEGMAVFSDSLDKKVSLLSEGVIASLRVNKHV